MSSHSAAGLGMRAPLPLSHPMRQQKAHSDSSAARHPSSALLLLR